MMRLFLVMVLTLVLADCAPQSGKSDLFLSGKSLGRNKNEKLEEASGLVASVRNKGLLWTHNDGGKAQLFLLDTTAATRKVFTLSNIKNRDWEDITLGAGPEPGISYLYVGDIGDNYARNPYKYIYRVKEPSLDDPELIDKVDKLVVKLSDKPRDTEALLFDPIVNRLYLISKRDRPGGLYEIANYVAGDTIVATRIAELHVNHIVAGDISLDGSEVILKSYENVYYWKRTGREPLTELLLKKPVHLPYQQEPQGEAIAWAQDGSGYYTLSENAKGERAKLFFYQRNGKQGVGKR